MKKTKIICSIGPASNSVEVMSEMVSNGMDCARINLSHATQKDILETIDVVKEVRDECKVPVAIMYDTKGPEFRTSEFKDGGVTLQDGDTIRMSKSCIHGNEKEFGVNHSEAIDYINVGDRVLLDNALFEFEVIDKKSDYVELKSLGNSKIQDHKTINVPGVDLNLNFLSDIDKMDMVFAATHSCDYLALSFVNTKDDVIAARKVIEEAGGDASIISKIESHKGVENIEDIIDESDGIMVARGDLGVDVPMEALPVIQKDIIRKCREKGKFVIVATEMMASMHENPRPSRAEVSDVANAVLDGTDCLMLSGETTIGKHPVKAVEIMTKACEFIEEIIDYSRHFDYKGVMATNDVIAKLAVDAAEASDIKAIVTPTMRGFTASKISNLRPNSIILACCPSYHIANKLVLYFGVKSVVTKIYENTDEMVENAKETAKKELNLDEGDSIIITGGLPLGESNTTNYLRIMEI